MGLFTHHIPERIVRIAISQERQTPYLTGYTLCRANISNVSLDMQTNTILLVVVLVLLVGGGVWWYQTYGPGAPQEEAGVELQIGGNADSQ